MRISAPRTPTWGTIFMGLRPMPRYKGKYMRGVAPHPDPEPLYMGLRPMPHLGIFFPKKIPKNPKKPNCIGFKPSNTDSEQGCRRQPCFLLGADSTAPQPPRRPAHLPYHPHPPHAAQRPTRPSFIPRSQSCRPSSRPRRAPPAPVSLPTEVLKLQDFSFYQSISNFVVSLPNLSKRREGTTFP